MEMRLKLLSTLFVSATIAICLSNGAPPTQPAIKKRTQGVRYTSQEDNLIIAELELRASTYQSARTWKEIQEKHKRKVLAKAEGFPVPRTATGLKLQFPKIVKKGVMVPGNVKKLYDEQFVKRFITPQERDLINTELLSCDTLYGDDTWARIIQKHNRLRESGRLGFENKRSVLALRSHFTHIMLPRGYADKRIIQKFPQHFTPDEGSTSITRVEQTSTDRSENVEDNEEDLCVPKYSPQEEDFIIKELESRASTYKTKRTWKEIEEVHRQKVLDKADGFSVQRTSHNLRRHFPVIIEKGFEVPDIVKRLYEANFVKRIITPQERELINRELLSCETLFSDDTWKRIAEEHDRLREAGRLGFQNKRKAGTLRTHFTHVMVRRGYVDKRVKRKFSQSHNPEEGEDQSNIGPSENVERHSEEDVWEPVMADINLLQRNLVDDYGVDTTLFVDPQGRRDNDIFEAYSPYEPRTF